VIFVTVGHQMPFDRLIRAVDGWAAAAGQRDLFAQIGDGELEPASFPSQRFLAPLEFQQRMDEADAIIGHAGTGTIIAALQRSKPLLVLPRLARFGETRTDHQIATARYFGDDGRILVANDETVLPAMIDQLAKFRPRSTIAPAASPELLRRLREFARL
jgi:UDP-N-acetylglucosamine transferase subunit ALG13